MSRYTNKTYIMRKCTVKYAYICLYYILCICIFFREKITLYVYFIHNNIHTYLYVYKNSSVTPVWKCAFSVWSTFFDVCQC